MRRSPVGEGFIERSHFFDAAGSMWVGGELVHMEDLVLHDELMDVRAPTHELVIAYEILRVRRRVAGSKANWALTDAGIGVLTGYGNDPESSVDTLPADMPADLDDEAESDSYSEEFAEFDALLEQTQHLLDRVSEGKEARRSGLAVGDLIVRDPDWNEGDRLAEWKRVLRDVDDLPASLAAALIWDAWEALEPMQRQHWLGSQLVSAHLRAQGKVTSHLFAFNVGLKAVPREQRRSHNRLTRIACFLDAMSASAESGMKEIARLSLAREQMARRLIGRRASSSLLAAIELILSRPLVSAEMVAKKAKVTRRGALNLIAELDVRERTGRVRYRAWGIL